MLINVIWASHTHTFRDSGMFNLKQKDVISKPHASLNKTTNDNENNYKTSTYTTIYKLAH